MRFQHVLNAVFHQPWLITPAAHATIREIVMRHVRAGQFPEAKASGGILAARPTKDWTGQPIQQMEIENGIAIIPVKGVLMKGAGILDKQCGACAPEDIADDLAVALASPYVAGILLDIESPGGHAQGISDLGAKIVAARGVKPVLAFAENECCSAAQWIAASASAFYAHPEAVVGSVGTYVYFLDESKAFEMEGYRPDIIVSEGSPFKAAGAPGTSLSADQRADIQKHVNEINARFKGHISANRPAVKPEAMNGRHYEGTEGVALGMVDSVCSYEQALADLRKMCGLG